MNQPAANTDANATSAYVIWVEFDIHPEHLAQFTSLVRINAAASLANEPGCRRFDVLLPSPASTTVALYEIYDDEAAFGAHLWPRPTSRCSLPRSTALCASGACRPTAYYRRSPRHSPPAAHRKWPCARCHRPEQHPGTCRRS